MYLVDLLSSKKDFATLINILASGFRDNANMAVRLASLAAVTNVIQVLMPLFSSAFILRGSGVHGA